MKLNPPGGFPDCLEIDMTEFGSTKVVENRRGELVTVTYVQCRGLANPAGRWVNLQGQPWTPAMRA